MDRKNFYSSSLAAASGVDTVLLIRNSRTIARATIQYTSIAKRVVHSKILPCTVVLGKTARNGAVNGQVRA